MEIPNPTEQEEREKAKQKALEKVKQKATIVNIDEIADAEARKAADAYMTEARGKTNLIKKFWKHTLFDEYYRQRQINRVKEEIKEKDNIYSGRLDDENSKIAHQNAMLGITERFQAEYDETLSDGEEKKILDKSNPEIVRVRNEITSLINAYATSNMDEGAFKNAKTRILDSIKDDTFNSAKNYADNLFEIAQNARLAIEHGAKMQELDYDLDVIVGKAKSSLKTEAHYNWVDKQIAYLKKSKVGRFVSPAALSTAVGLAYSISIGVGTKAMRTKAFAIGSLGASVAVSGLLAGVNESQRLAEERAQHEVEMAEGNTFKEGDKRREKMDTFRYETIKSTELSQKLIELMFEKDKDGNLSPKDIKETDIENIMNQIAQIEARNSLNSKKKIDLISYSSVGSVEKERTDLTILTARAKVELRKRIEGDFKNGIPEGQKFDDYLKNKIQVVEDSLMGGEKGITAQDKAFRKFKAKRVAGKVLSTMTIGVIVGATVQEVVAFFKDDIQGFVENLFNNNTTGSIQTPLQHLSEWISGNHSHMNMGNLQQLGIGENGIIKFPEGTSILSHSDGTFDVLRGDDVVSKNIHLNFNPDGTLDPDSISRLGQDGIIVNVDHTLVSGTEEVTVPADEYINNHGGDHEVDRIGWYDNDTPKPVFDQNELKLHWGGDTGIDSHGNYVFDVTHMTSDGSYTGEFSVDAQEQIKNGALKMVFSLTDGTQNHVFELPIGTDGKVIIDPNSEIGKLFFANENGHAVFKGRFAEVIQSFGEKEGIEQIKSLATLEGVGVDSIKDIVETVTEESSNTIAVPLGVEPPMYLPFYIRRPLEPVSYKQERMLNRLGLVPIRKSQEKKNVIEISVEDDKKSEEEKAQKILFYITKEQYDAFKDDIKFINKKIQSAEGIADIKESDLKSEYAKMRYGQLKHIQDGVPVTWNKEELQEIGDELEKILSVSVIKKEGEEGVKEDMKDIKDVESQTNEPEVETTEKTKELNKVKIIKKTPSQRRKVQKNIFEKSKKIEELVKIGSKTETENKYYLITGISKNSVDVISKNKETGQYLIESIKLDDIKEAINSNLVQKTETDFIDFEKEVENYNYKTPGGVLGNGDSYYKIVEVKKTWYDTSKYIALEKNKDGEIRIVTLKEKEISKILTPLEIPIKEEEQKIIEEPKIEPTQKFVEVKETVEEKKVEKITEEKKGRWKWPWRSKEKEEEVEKLPPIDYRNKDFIPQIQHNFREILKEGTKFEGKHHIYITLLTPKEEAKRGKIRVNKFDKNGNLLGEDTLDKRKLRKNYEAGYITIHGTKE